MIAVIAQRMPMHQVPVMILQIVLVIRALPETTEKRVLNVAQITMKTLLQTYASHVPAIASHPLKAAQTQHVSATQDIQDQMVEHVQHVLKINTNKVQDRLLARIVLISLHHPQLLLQHQPVCVIMTTSTQVMAHVIEFAHPDLKPQMAKFDVLVVDLELTNLC